MISKVNSCIIFILLLFSIIFICCNIKFKVDKFTDMSCYAQQNKHYLPEELIFKSKCPNLVILKKYKNGYPLFYAEEGDENGPYFSKDYSTYYYLGTSPNGELLDLEYELYYYPMYNPIRWFYGPYIYHRPNAWYRKNKFRKLNKLKKHKKFGALNKNFDNISNVRNVRNIRDAPNVRNVRDAPNAPNVRNVRNVRDAPNLPNLPKAPNVTNVPNLPKAPNVTNVINNTINRQSKMKNLLQQKQSTPLGASSRI